METQPTTQDISTSFFVSVVRGENEGKKVSVLTDIHEANDVFTHKTFECWVSKYLTENHSEVDFADPEVWKFSSELNAQKQKEELLETCKKEGREIIEAGVLERTSC